MFLLTERNKNITNEMAEIILIKYSKAFQTKLFAANQIWIVMNMRRINIWISNSLTTTFVEQIMNWIDTSFKLSS